MKCMALGLALKQRRKATRKWAIQVPRNCVFKVSKIPLFLQSEEMSEKAFVKVRSLGVMASPQRRKCSGGSPQLLRGSFLHKAAAAEKAVENLSPKKVNMCFLLRNTEQQWRSRANVSL